MRTHVKFRLLVLAALIGLTPGVGLSQSVHQWLQEAGISSDDIAKLDSGEPLVWIPKVDDPTELTLLAIAHIGVTAEDIRDMARDMAGLAQRSEQVLQVGVFSDDPTWEDAATLRLPEGDIKDLKKCKVGDCLVRLTAGGIESLHQSVDWSASDPAGQVNGYLAGWLATYLRGYKESGNDALAVYADKKETQSVAAGLDILLRKTELLIQYDGEFYRYVRNYPAGEWARAEHLFYWTVEDLNLKPTVFLNHMTIRGGEKPDALMVSKQIYASHYIQAGVKAYAALPASDDDPSKGVYVLLTQRFRFDGNVDGIKRKLLEDGTKKAARSQLKSFKAYAEAAGRG